jgi:hypothetical protein
MVRPFLNLRLNVDPPRKASMTARPMTHDPTQPATDSPRQAREDRRDWLAGRTLTRVDYIVAALIGVAVIALAYIFRSVVVPTDPWHYVRSALHFPSSGWVALGYTRYGIVLASLPPARLFGDAQISYYFWPLLSAGVLSSALALLARRFWGWTAAAVTLLLLLSNRVMFYNLSRGYPDIMAMALFALAILFALLARDRLLQGRSAVWHLLAVGFLLGWGFEVRETSLLVWPLIAVILWRRGRLLGTLLWVSLPILGWAALDIGISALAYGDPLLKLHILTGLGGSKPTAPVTTASIQDHTWYVGQSRWFYLTFVPRTAWATSGGVWMVGVGAVALLGLLVRNWPLRLVSAWFLGTFLITVAPTGLLDPSHPRGRIDVERYWIPFFPPSALAVGGLVAVIGAWLVRRTPLSRAGTLWRQLPAAVLAVLVCWGPVAYGIGFATTHPAFAPNGGDALEDLRDHLRDQNVHPKRVWSDWETVRILPAYQRDFWGGDKVWSGKPTSLTSPRAVPKSGDYVVLFSARSTTCPFCRTALRPWLRKNPHGAPSNWERVYVSDTKNLELYKVR